MLSAYAYGSTLLWTVFTWRGLERPVPSLSEVLLPIKAYYIKILPPYPSQTISPSSQLHPHSRSPSLHKKPHHPSPSRNLHFPFLPFTIIPPLFPSSDLPPLGLILLVRRFILSNAPPLLVFDSSNGIPFVGFENEFYRVGEDIEEPGD